MIWGDAKWQVWVTLLNVHTTTNAWLYTPGFDQFEWGNFLGGPDYDFVDRMYIDYETIGG